jgi:hypothetical protein
MVTEKEGINHDAAGTDWMVPNNKSLVSTTGPLRKPGLNKNRTKAQAEHHAYQSMG